MIDWTTISSLGTTGGTFVLAVITLYSVRTSNRAARNAERALQVGLRPILFPSRLDDPRQKLRWGDDHWASVEGGRALLEEEQGIVYMAMSLRNVGSGIALLLGWRVEVDRLDRSSLGASEARRGGIFVRPDPASFVTQGRDIYVPSADLGFWQAAMREAADGDRDAMATALRERRGVFIDLLYGDQEGGQRTISRFSVTPYPGSDGAWMSAVVRHWNLDRPDPR